MELWREYKKPLITFSVLVLYVFFFIIMPHLYKRQANDTIMKVLNYWAMGDSATGAHYWQDRNKFPPIYDLVSYKIIGKTYGKKNRMRLANYYITLTFARSNILPTDKVWFCEITDTKGVGWKITQFYMMPGQ